MEALISQNEAAKILRLSVRTLERYRIVGGGPRYVKLGRRIVYRPGDLDAWVASNTVSSTSQRSNVPRGPRAAGAGTEPALVS
jgi:hypothetical protein